MICLSELSDYQKSLLTRLAYLNIDLDKYLNRKQKNNKITISDLKHLIFDINELYIGSLHMPQLKKKITKIDTTSLELIEKLEEAGLGEIEIVDYVDDKRNGFYVVCFRDKEENMGFSFRGTDPKSFSSFIVDGIADLEGFLTNNTFQIKEADWIFNKYKNLSGRNYVYGHSLGGFLAENVYLKNYENIRNVFVVNPFHINSDILDSEEKIAAFNDKEKFSCFVIDGDYVSFINIPIKFSKNIHYVKNSDKTANNPVGNHMIEAGDLDENGSFIECRKEDSFNEHSDEGADKVIRFIRNNKVKNFMRKCYLNIKKCIFVIKKYLNKIFNRNEKVEEIKSVNMKVEKNDFEDYLKPNNYSKNNLIQGLKRNSPSRDEEYVK